MNQFLIYVALMVIMFALEAFSKRKKKQLQQQAGLQGPRPQPKPGRQPAGQQPTSQELSDQAGKARQAGQQQQHEQEEAAHAAAQRDQARTANILSTSEHSAPARGRAARTPAPQQRTPQQRTPQQQAQETLQEMFRRLGVEVEPVPGRAAAVPPPLREEPEEHHESLRSQLEGKGPKRLSTAGRHADKLGADSASHFDFKTTDLVSLDDDAPAPPSTAEAAPTTTYRRHKLDTSRPALINALVLGEILGKPGGLS